MYNAKYSQKWINILSNLHNLNNQNIIEKIYFMKMIATEVNTFLKNIKLILLHRMDTIFHQPEKKYTLQIGNGNTIAKITGITTISKFRDLDVSLGGQGAPLVPIMI